MKIITEHFDIVDIFAICWWDNGETSLLGLPKNNGGLTLYAVTGTDKDNIQVIDPIINWSGTYYNNNNNSYGLYHWALINEELLDNLLEYDEIAYKRFLEIIKTEGLVSPEFY